MLKRMLVRKVEALEQQVKKLRVVAPEVQDIQGISVGRDDVIEGLAEIARGVHYDERARVAAWAHLAEIYMLKPRNFRDLTEFYGWTETELRYYCETGKVPERLGGLAERDSKSLAEILEGSGQNASSTL
jgi:hypothetical protein